MKKMTAEERLDWFRLLAERRDSDWLDQRSPSQLARLVELDRLLEGGGTGAAVEKTARGKKAGSKAA